MNDRDGVAPARLEARARRAYETGRVAAALRRSLLIAPLVGLVLLCCSDWTAPLVSGAGLVAAVTFCLWRGEAFRRGVRPGLTAGLVPMLAPIVIQSTGHLCGADSCLLYPAVCVVAGLCGGVALGMFAPRPREAQGVPLMSASLIAGLAGSVGCLLYGLIGVAGMVLGLLAGAAPVLLARRVRG